MIYAHLGATARPSSASPPTPSNRRTQASERRHRSTNRIIAIVLYYFAYYTHCTALAPSRLGAISNHMGAIYAQVLSSCFVPFPRLHQRSSRCTPDRAPRVRYCAQYVGGIKVRFAINVVVVATATAVIVLQSVDKRLQMRVLLSGVWSGLVGCHKQHSR